MKICRFFAAGNCTRIGCTYSHEKPSSGLNADAPPFVPSGSVIVPDVLSTSVLSTSAQVPCRFFTSGFCNKGQACAFKHAVATTVLPSLTKGVGTHPKAEIPSDPKSVNPPTETREIGGALVSYGNGVQILKLQFQSDFSAVRISDIPSNSKTESVQEYLASYDEIVPLTSIRLLPAKIAATWVADIKVQDPRFAERLTAKAGNQDQNTGYQISTIQAGNEKGSSASRIQVSSVVCTWYKPSRVAWLHFRTFSKATEAATILRATPKLFGRKLQVAVQGSSNHYRHRGPIVVSVQIGNLDVGATQGQIRRRLPKDCQPIDIVIGPCSYSLSHDDAQEAVRAILCEIGPLETWDVNTVMSATKVKAVARFENAEAALTAVKRLNQSTVPQLSNSKLFLAPLISVKFNVLKGMYDALQGDLDDLKTQIRDAGYVTIKAYPPTVPDQRLISVRIYGEDASSVAKAKSAFEGILAGSVAMNGTLTAWHEFFLSSPGLVFLKELQQKHDVFIYRDARKSQLSLYGSRLHQSQVQEALVEKVHELSQIAQVIELSPADLKMALEGGYRRIVTALGKQKAILDILPPTKTITIKGSTSDFETAKSVLRGVTREVPIVAAMDAVQTQDCAVCWTRAENAFRTDCGHIYCSDCFEDQCSSVSQNGIPVRCYGDLGKCSQIFANKKLKNALPLSGYEKLLENSLSIHIRARPNEFQYCCTPDCEHIYRVSTDGAVFTCAACLTTICTTCHVVSHDGLSCDEYRTLGSEGNEAFEEWKQMNHVKDCPNCKVSIQKSYGCNHMECRICHTHICWFCMRDFGTGAEVYSHMNNTHPDGGMRF